MKYFICNSKYGVTLEWSRLYSEANDSWKRASRGATLEVLVDGVRKVIKTKN
jgi:hypothetical protein